MEQFDVEDVFDLGVSEPGVVFEGQEILFALDEKPESVRGYVRHFSVGSVLSKLLRFHFSAPR